MPRPVPRRVQARGLGSTVPRLVLALTALPSVAQAHPGLAPEPHDLWQTWPASPGVIAGLAVGGAWYALGVRRVWHRAGVGRGLARWRVWAYAAGLATLALALLSPLDAVADALFTAHMGQHLLLILVAAPLLAAGVPALAMLWALPEAVWVPAGLVYLGAASALFVRWLREAEHTAADAAVLADGCGSCHAIVELARPMDAEVGDCLTLPSASSPGAAMPNLDVTGRDARDVAGYVYTPR